MNFEEVFNACAFGDVDAIKSYLRDGGDPNIINQFGLPLITIAVENSRTEIVKLLIEGGANVNIQDEYGQTPLFFAVDTAIDVVIRENGEPSLEIIDILLDNGADLRISDFKGRTGITIAKNYNHTKMIEYLNNRLKKRM